MKKKRTQKRERAAEIRRRQRLLREIDKLVLITRTYIDEADLTELAELAGVERAVLSRRLAGIVKRLKKTRRDSTIVRAIKSLHSP